MQTTWMQKQFKKPSKIEMKNANVHPETGLATDYLNLFNEYIMLAEMVADGSMEVDILDDWQAMDYEAHFIKTNFSGVEIVLASYRSLCPKMKTQFEKQSNKLISLIKKHQTFTVFCLEEIKHQRDIVEAMIAGVEPIKNDEISHTQEDIDALFD